MATEVTREELQEAQDLIDGKKTMDDKIHLHVNMCKAAANDRLKAESQEHGAKNAYDQAVLTKHRAAGAESFALEQLILALRDRKKA